MNITLNRESEWKRAFLDGLKINGHVIEGLESDDPVADSAVMITGSIDSFGHDHIWDKMSFDWSMAPNTSCRVSCFSSNSKTAKINGKLVDFDKWLSKGQNSVSEYAELSAHLFSPAGTHDKDGLLCCRGRYLWLRFDIIAQNRAGFKLEAIKLRLPNEKIVDYLPDIYRRNQTEGDFFPRFMSVFESIFFEIEDDINRIGEKLDYNTADEVMLVYLASWLGISQQTASPEALREQIRSAVQEYRLSGTREGLQKAVESQTGFTPVIIEHFQVEKMAREGRDRQIYTDLFGTNPYKVCIMLPEEALASRGKIAGLTSRVRACVPAHVEFDIIPLTSNVQLDRHTYLERNSALSDFNSMIVEERSVLYDVYLGGEKDEK